jgi:hypothetical protein
MNSTYNQSATSGQHHRRLLYPPADIVSDIRVSWLDPRLSKQQEPHEARTMTARDADYLKFCRDRGYTEPPADPEEDADSHVEEPGSQEEQVEDESQSENDDDDDDDDDDVNDDQDNEESESDSEASDLPAGQQWDQSRIANARQHSGQDGGRTERWVRGSRQ